MKGLPNLACIVVACLLCVATPALAADNAGDSATDRRIAITFDDLPWASLDPTTALPTHGSVPPRIADKSAQLVRAIEAAGTPAIGFVNSARLLVNGQPQADRMDLLEAWLDAGLELGNHTATHADLHAVGVQAYESDILACDGLLRPLLASHGLAPEWFRHPYLRTGLTAEDKAALGAMLAGRGYRVAPVTITTSDWIWAAA